eukprot:286680-Karenia_brevis.AAC.1
MKQIAALTYVCHMDLRLTWHEHVTVSDASLSGISVSQSSWESADIAKVGSSLERFRYKGREKVEPRKSALSFAANLDPFCDVATVKTIVSKTSEETLRFEPNPDFEEIPARLLKNDSW